MKTTVKIEGRNMADLMALECVRSIEKLKDGRLMVTVQTVRQNRRATAFVGDTIEYDSEKAGVGNVIRTNKNRYWKL